MVHPETLSFANTERVLLTLVEFTKKLRSIGLEALSHHTVTV